MIDLAVLILVGREELHIRRCLEKLAVLEPKQVCVVESQPGDRTHEIAVETGRALGWTVFDKVVSSQSLVVSGGDSGVENQLLTTNKLTTQLVTVFHKWPGTHGPQVNWALDNVGIKTKWVMRLDADEYLMPETIVELKETLARLDRDPSAQDVTLISMPLIQVWSGRVIKFGTGTIVLPRIFKYGVGRSDDRVMDEKIYVTEGREITLKHGFADDNLISIDEWTKKHLDYAEREARAYLEGVKGGKRGMYYRLPPYFRAVVYFCIRYFLRGGFLEGREGFSWHFFQGLWYRCMVDWKISRVEKSVPSA